MNGCALFVSFSVLYRKIVKEIFDELDWNLSLEDSVHSAIDLLQSRNLDLLIIDGAFSRINEGFLSYVSDSYPFLRKIILEEKKFVLKKSARMNDKTISFILKPIEEGYKNNFNTLRNGIRAVIGELADFRSHEFNVCDNKCPSKYSLILIASSTGGPGAIESIFSNLELRIYAPFLIVQHMPAAFTKNFADDLSKVFSIDASEAQDGDCLQPGRVLIAPGGVHMLVDSQKRIFLEKSARVNGVRPSADVLFKSVAKYFAGEKIMSIILTGMGNDGTDGVRALKRSCDCCCIAQDEESSIVYGMPRSVVEAGLADMVVSLDSISSVIEKFMI